jgi:hypothetical protein
MSTKVEDIMTPDPLTLAPTDTVGDAYGLMRERGFRHVPISEAGLLLGLISMTDVGHLGAKVPEILARPLHEVMTKKLITIKPGEPIEKAAVLMASPRRRGRQARRHRHDVRLARCTRERRAQRRLATWACAPSRFPAPWLGCRNARCRCCSRQPKSS